MKYNNLKPHHRVVCNGVFFSKILLIYFIFLYKYSTRNKNSPAIKRYNTNNDLSSIGIPI